MPNRKLKNLQPRPRAASDQFRQVWTLEALIDELQPAASMPADAAAPSTKSCRALLAAAAKRKDCDLSINQCKRIISVSFLFVNQLNFSELLKAGTIAVKRI